MTRERASMLRYKYIVCHVLLWDRVLLRVQNKTEVLISKNVFRVLS